MDNHRIAERVLKVNHASYMHNRGKFEDRNHGREIEPTSSRERSNWDYKRSKEVGNQEYPHPGTIDPKKAEGETVNSRNPYSEPSFYSMKERYDDRPTLTRGSVRSYSREVSPSRRIPREDQAPRAYNDLHDEPKYAFQRRSDRYENRSRDLGVHPRDPRLSLAGHTEHLNYYTHHDSYRDSKAPLDDRYRYRHQDTMERGDRFSREEPSRTYRASSADLPPPPPPHAEPRYKESRHRIGYPGERSASPRNLAAMVSSYPVAPSTSAPLRTRPPPTHLSPTRTAAIDANSVPLQKSVRDSYRLNYR